MKKISTKGILFLAFALIPASMLIGPLPYSPFIYYAFLIILSIIAFSHPVKINFKPVVFLLLCAASIVVNNPPSFFHSWERLLLFSVLLIATFPIIDSKKLFVIRYYLFKSSICIATFVGAISLFCYTIGYNYMAIARNREDITVNDAGWFSGIAAHSMMLGPAAAIGIVYCVHKITSSTPKATKQNWFYISLLAMCFCSCLLSASRSAIVAAVVGTGIYCYFKYQHHLKKLYKIYSLGLILLIGLFPIYSQFTNALIEKQQTNIATGGSMVSSRAERWEHRIIEFKTSPIFGIGFCAINPEYKKEHNHTSGQIEPGSSWLALLSMTGTAGFLVFLSILIPVLSNLLTASKIKDNRNIPLVSSIIVLFCVTMIAEGYLLSAGGYFCFLFWLTLGIGGSLTNNHKDLQYTF